MSSKILMPSGGQTVDEMVILKWYKQVGETVSRGDILFEIETDKAILTVESFAAGILLEINYPEGQLVKTGEVVAIIGDVNEKPALVTGKNPATAPPTIENLSYIPEKKNAADDPVTQSANNGNRVLASPLAKNLARIEQIKIEDVAGYVSKKLIKKADVNNYLENGRFSKQAAGDNSVYYIDTTTVRKTIARRMKESISTAPHYIASVDIDSSALIRLRNKLNKNKVSGSDKISYNDIIMKVVAKAIEAYPLVNSSFEEGRIKVYKDVNFGLAIATENGIIVPVVRQANKKAIFEIASANNQLIEKVKTNKLLPADITGGTITLSNLGMFGINNFTAIINQPESCILAVGAIIKKAVVVDDEIAIREMMDITGSFDHRVIDGAYGAAFLMRIKAFLEDPELLLF